MIQSGRQSSGHPVSRIVPRSLLCSASLFAVLATGVPLSVHAEERHWDANATGMGSGGSGTWDLASLNWSPNGDGVSGPYVDPWDNSALDDAIFGGVAGTVTLGAPITVHNITFNTNGYVLDGGTLTLGGATPTISVTTGATRINSIVAGTAGLAKAGGGALQLYGANSFSGDIALLGGSLYAATDGALGAAGNNVVTAAGANVTLRIDGANTGRSIIIGDGGRLTVSGEGIGSALISGNGQVSVAGLGQAAAVRLTNDANSYTGSTTFSGCNGVCYAYFSSIEDLGIASSLGAPTTVEDGTIIFNQQSQYSDRLIYTGGGHSSNRNWDINGNAALIVNEGSGALTLTGDIDISSSGSFTASTADINLLGVLSGGSFGFGGTAGRVITLGDANTFAGTATIGVVVKASKLANIGEASSLGAGTTITLSGGALDYTGAGSASDRIWAINGVSSILNNGTGALDLSGDLALNGPVANPYDLTLGGSFSGINNVSGVMSGNGNLISEGAGTWVLSGANTHAGTVTVNSGTLRAGNAVAFGNTKGFIVNGGTLDLDGYDMTTPSLGGTGGEIALGSATLTVLAKTEQEYAGSITGSGGLTKSGAGTLTLSGISTYSGATTINGGALALDFGDVAAPDDNIISGSSQLVLSGGTFEVRGAAGEVNNQSVNGLTVSAGSNTIRAVSGVGGTANISLGAINRTGGLVNFVLPGAGVITTSHSDGALGGWATINGSDYAKVVSGGIIAFDSIDYTNKDDAGTWSPGDVISDTAGDPDTAFFGTVGSDIELGGLRYTANANSNVTIGAGNTLGVDGTIIVAPSVATSNQTLTGGSLTSGSSGVLGIQQNGDGLFSIASAIIDESGPTSFSKGGAGTVALTGVNSYTGSTTLTAGTLRISSIANGGMASGIGASTADAANLVIEGGTFQYNGSSTTTDRGFTLVNGSPARTIEITDGATNLTFAGQVTSPDDAGFTKTGSGTLTLANTSNDYVGITTVSSGTLAVTALTDGGTASSIGAASSDPASIVLAGGTLAYTGGTASTDRGMTLGAGGGGIGVTDANAALTISGALTGSSLRKTGDGTLILSGANDYTGDTIVDGGTLRAGAATAFGSEFGYITVNGAGTLDLGGFDIVKNGLKGSGTVDLGANTLTVRDGSAIFTGAITGTGGFTKSGTYTQNLDGCDNSYTGVTTLRGRVSVDCLRDGGVNSGIGASTSDAENLLLQGGTLAYTGGTVETDRGFTLVSGVGYIDVVDAATTLTFAGEIQGTGALQKNGAGTLVLAGTNGNANATRVAEGTLRVATDNVLGRGALSVFNNATALLDLDGHDNVVSYITGGGTTGGRINLGGATLTVSTGYNSTANFAGIIEGSGSLIKNGGSYQALSGCDNSYDGATVINGGTFAVTCLGDGGANSSIGSSSSAASNLILNGGVFRYMGVGDSTDRRFTLGAASSRIEGSGTGAIVFTDDSALTFLTPNSAQTLTLGGTNTDDNILSAQITNNGTGITRLTKTDAGTWILTNPNSSFTGITTINGGVLGVDKLADGGQASSIGASSAAASNLVIGNGSTLRYTGAGDTTNRLFTLSAGVTYIESSGTGAIVFTDTGTVTLANNNQARTIALGGTNTDNNTLAGSIGNAGTGVTTLAKNDSGTWILTGNHSYTGSTNINGGILFIGDGGTTGSIVSGTINNFGALGFDRSDTLAYAGDIVGTGSVLQQGTGATILTGTSTYSGGTTISAGTLRLGDGGTTGSIVGDVANDGTFTFDRSNGYTFGGVISGSGIVSQIGTGTTVLTGINSYSGGTLIDAGTLQISADANLGAASGNVTFDGGTLRTTASLTSSRAMTLAGAGTILTDTGTTFDLSGVISGAGAFTKSGAGTLVLTADSDYTGGTTISAGTLQLGDGGTGGWIEGDVANNGTLTFDRSDNKAFAGLVSGTGGLIQNGSGIVTLTADNSYAGATVLNAGTLRINGDQSTATGLTTVNNGATLGGSGLIGGSVVVNNGGMLAPGNSPGTLTIAGNLSLSSGSVLDFEFGEANVVGGPLNDLIEVGGELVLDGTINVTETAGGTFGGGIYRVFNYGGALTDNGLTLGTMPAGSSVTVQTSVAGQVNLINSAGLSLSFWDGDGGPKFNDVVNGGNGIWHLDGVDNNWTDAVGGVNAAYADGTFAIFAGTGGTVTVDNSGGAVTATGMQFASDSYLIAGDALTLVGPSSTIRVGDGTAAGAGFTTTIGTELTGATQLVKTDLGTLVLSGTNSYTGGTLINEGTLSISDNANLGAAASGVTINNGTLHSTAGMTIDRAVTLTGAATLSVTPGVAFTVDGVIAGAGSLTKAGGLVILNGDNTYTGGTTITEGTLQIGLGGMTGSIVGDVVNNSALVFNRAGALTYAGAVSGTGQFTKAGTGTLTMTGVSTYMGATRVVAGTLQLQSGGQINGTTGLTVDGGGQMIVDGTGSALITGSAESVIGAGPNNSGTLIVRNGANATLSALQLAKGNNSTGRLDVIGAGSQLTASGVTYLGRLGLATVNVLDGGRMSTLNGLVGGQLSQSGAAVAVSGAGSQWDVAGAFTFRRGTVNVADGGAVVADSAVIGFWGAGLNAPSADMSVTGAGSRFETNGAFEITNTISNTARGTLTIADGGVVRVGGGTLAMGIGDARLNIGGVGNVPASVRAGTLDAAEVTFAAANNHVNFNHIDTDYTFAARMSGAGYVMSSGSGTTILIGDNAYTGATSINAGTLLVNGDQSGATGLTAVSSGATLGGIGTIGGNVAVADGGTINPGDLGTAPGTLTIAGNLNLAAASTLNYNFGQANVVGGPLNDLITVGGDLTLDGTLNVQTSGGGSFDPGVYRVISYAGALTDSGLTLGTVPSPDFYVQTSVPGQVNLVNTAGLTLRYWDGDTIASKNNGLIEGGNGLWQNLSGNDNWTEETGAANAPFTDSAFAVFMGAAGTVTVDDSLGAINASGMQFLTDGYAIEGDAINLVGAPASTIRVGDGTAAGAGITATIASELTGAAQLVKADLGTLVLTGANSYTGGTAINGGILQIASDANLGDAAGGLSFNNGATLNTTADITTARAVDLVGDGNFLTDTGTALTLDGAITGTGGFTKSGAGTLILTAANSYTGATNVAEGNMFVNGDQSGATGLTSVLSGATLGGTGIIGGDVTIGNGATLAAGMNGIGTLTINGDLALASGSRLAFEFGEANAAGGALNDLVAVSGDLTLDGTIDVTVPAGGAFDAGVYRVFDYGGTLTDNGLALGTMPAGSNTIVQTSVAGHVNLVNSAGLTLNFWDGTDGIRNNGAIEGGDGLWQNSAGDDSWTEATGAVNAAYADGAFAIFSGAGGTVTVDKSLGAVTASGMQFAADGYAIGGDELTLVGAQSVIRVGDGSTAGADMTATIGAVLTGDAQLVKTDAGTLVLAGANSYTGGTAVQGGTLAVSADANLGNAAGNVTLDGGTLRTTADLASGRSVTLAGDGAILTDADTRFTLNGGLSGAGVLTKAGAGTLVLTGDNAGYIAGGLVTGGTLAVDGIFGGNVDVASGGRLEGNGAVAAIANAGVVAPGRGIGTLTVAGDYVGTGGTLEIEAVLGDDGSATDRLVIGGGTSGTTRVTVINRDGLGAPTVEGIRIIDVAGASDGSFVLNGDYMFQGEQAVIAGAYGYRLYKNGVADPQDGDWYLRSSLLNPPVDPEEPGEPGGPDEPEQPLYQPGVPVYEGYAQTLQALNGLPTLQQRVGNRAWANVATPDGMGIWGRMDASRQRPEALVSTSDADQNIDSWQMQMGLDAVLGQRGDGATLIGGITAHYGKADNNVASIFGNGRIDTRGYGLGATLTWYGPEGFYADAQAKFSWFDSDLKSDALGTLVKGNDGRGQAFSLEVGKRSTVGNKLTLTPQIQMVYAHVGFDSFADPAGAQVSAARGDSLKSRWGLSIDRQNSWDSAGGTRRSHVYGLVNLSYEWLDGAQVDVSGTPIASRNRRLWGELGLGGSYSWGNGRYTLYTEVSGDTPIADFGKGYSLKGNAGFRIQF